jgi:hypothetical protein
MTTTLESNNRTRKSLAEQIDRLDRILDGLAEGLNEAVAGAVQTAVSLAVKEAVQSLVAEVLSNADLMQRLAPGPGVHTHPTPPEPAARTAHPFLEGLAGGLQGIGGKVAALAALAGSRVAGALRSCWQGTRAGVGHAWRWTANLARRGWRKAIALLCLASRFRKPLLIAAGVGTAVGLGCFFAGPLVASVVSGVVGFAGSLAVGALNALRRVLALGEPAGV